MRRNPYTCGCGSSFAHYTESSKRRHLKTKKHVLWEEREREREDTEISERGNDTHIEECPICYEEKIEQTISCGQCHNEICVTCYNGLRMLKCPFCRSSVKTDSVTHYSITSHGWTVVQRGCKVRRPRKHYPKPSRRSERIRVRGQEVEVVPESDDGEDGEDGEDDNDEDIVIRLYYALQNDHGNFVRQLDDLKEHSYPTFRRVMAQVFTDAITIRTIRSTYP
jgi:hypothetical protein